MSFKAIESSNPEDDKQWLTYWVVFSCLNVCDKALGMVLSVIPMYNLVKIIFYVWLFHPSTKGATLVYTKFLQGLLKKYEQKN